MLQTVDNCYYLPNFSGDGVAVQTNTPANTAMRGPGWVPATYTMEAIMEHVARYSSYPSQIWLEYFIPTV